MTSKSLPPYSPNIIFDALVSILAVDPDRLNVASISYHTEVIHADCEMKYSFPSQ
jgi:hypothetical protein